jgi:hypothetical protein
MIDITLVSVPYTIIDVPPLGIAVLKGAVKSAGFNARTIDLGMDLFNAVDRDRRVFNSLQEVFVYQNLASDHHDERIDIIQRFINQSAEKILSRPSRWIGISVFSYYSHLASFMLCNEIKRRDASARIVIGGPAVGISVSEGLIRMFEFTGLERIMSFGDLSKRRGLADDIILGDGEQPLIDLLSGSERSADFHVQNYRDPEWEQKHPFSDFSDFVLSDYEGNLNRGYPQLPIFTSKGCVRNCDFCDVNVVQNRFRFRNGKNIVAEMIHLADTYNIRDFILLDSLANGSLKSLKEWVTELAAYNRANPDRRITWSASGWICRPIGQIKEDFYPVLAESGCGSVTIGAESGSNHVLEAMDKKTNVEALYHEIELFRRNNIRFINLMLIGHWAETWQDFLDTCILVYNLAPYVKSGHCVAIASGSTFKIGSNTPADVDRSRNQLVSIANHIWWSAVNPELTAKERYFRLLLLERLANVIGVPLQDKVTLSLYETVHNHFDEINDFYTKMTADLDRPLQQHAQWYYNHFDEFMELLHQKNPRTRPQVNLRLVVDAGVVRDDPAVLTVTVNGREIFKSPMSQGAHDLTFADVPVDTEQENVLRISFSNKRVDDTLVDADGNILADKFVSFRHLFVDDIDVFADHEFYYGHVQYQEDHEAVIPKPGFWRDPSSLELRWQHPWLTSYCKRSKLNRNLQGYIVSPTTNPRSMGLTTDEFDEHRDKVIELLDRLSC